MRAINTDEGYDIWVADYEAWHNGIRGLIKKKISEEASVWFTNISSGLTITYKGAYGGGFGGHNSLLNELNAYLEKLGELLSRY